MMSDNINSSAHYTQEEPTHEETFTLKFKGKMVNET